MCTNVNFITKLILKKQIPNRHLNISMDINGSLFRSELMLAYRDMSLPAALLNNSTFFYNMATYLCEDNNGFFMKQKLHVGDVVTIQEEDYGENYAIIEAIFSHRANNDKLYAFVIVNWFEETTQNKLDCPIYRLLMDDNNWRRVFPISVIDFTNKIHFVHNCITCTNVTHDTLNFYYIKNKYYFNIV